MNLKKFSVLLGLLCTIAVHAQNDSTTKDSSQMHRRKIAVWSVNTGVPVAMYAVLYNTWYKDYGLQKFHWTNDGQNWLQMDKVGHAFSGYFLAVNSAASFRYAGYNNKKSAVFGTAVSLGFQTALEYFDGRSPQWGASSGDLISNAVGAAFGGAQAFIWGKVKVPFRVTFRTTALHNIRPEILGSTLPERLLKDYNGQTYWLDFNFRKMGIKPNWWPKWLGISIGYSAEGMVGGDDNIWIDKNGNTQDYSSIIRYRQYLISPSLAFGYLKPKNKILRTLLLITDYWRLPMPTMEFNSLKQPRFRWIYW
ncbi:MAG: DUF2279 domain-containing protein [Bacteroidia bacterium]|nr:DUF2279 domain-containing protein [Bacteroidia bacterium]